MFELVLRRASACNPFPLTLGQVIVRPGGPGRPLSPGAARVTGLSDADLADAPSIDEALPAFLAFLGDAPLAH